MVKITLSKRKVAIIDDADVSVIGGNKWVASCSGKKWYAVRGRGETRMYMHRMIIRAGNGIFVDHINGDSLDNRKINLRKCTQQQNSFNSKRKNNSYKGVWQCMKNRWTARLMLDGKNLYLGRFDSPIQAAQAYDKAAKKYYGEFARTNF